MRQFHRARFASASIIAILASSALAACGGGGSTAGGDGGLASNPNVVRGSASPSSSPASGGGTGSAAPSGAPTGAGGSSAAPGQTPAPGTTATPAPGSTPAPGTTATPAPGTTATPAPGTTATPAPGTTATPAPGTTATPAPGTTATPITSLVVGPTGINGGLGGFAQIGVVDPGYNGNYTVTSSGGGTLGSLLGTVSNAVGGVLTNSPGGSVLNLNLANAVSLGLLGPNGSLVTICEQSAPSRCQSVNIMNPGSVPVVGSTISSIAEKPGSSQLLNLTTLPLSGVNLSNFTVTGMPSGVTVMNLGSGQFSVNAAASAMPGSTGFVTLSDGTHTVTIPLMVL